MQLIFVIDLICCKLAALISCNSCLWIFYILNHVPSNFLSFFFSFFLPLMTLGKTPLVQCSIEVVKTDILLLLIIGRKHSIFPH